MTMPKHFWSGGIMILLLDGFIGAIVGTAIMAFWTRLLEGAFIGALCGVLIAIPEYLLAMFHRSAGNNPVTKAVQQFRLFAFICFPVLCIAFLWAAIASGTGASFLARAASPVRYGAIISVILFIFVKIRNSARSR